MSSPDPVLGERVCAVMVPEPGATAELAELIEWLLDRRIAKQKLPESLIVLDQMPRTASGKIQKFKLRGLDKDRHEGGRLPEDQVARATIHQPCPLFDQVNHHHSDGHWLSRNGIS